MNSPAFVLDNNIFWLSLPPYSDSKLGGSGYWFLLSGSLQERTLPSNLPAFPYCSRTSCSPSCVPQRSVTEALILQLGSMRLVLNKKKNSKPSSPHACILFLDITNGGWGLSGCDLLCNRWSFNVLWVTEWDRGFCAAAHVCAVMMNECLVCCVYGSVM